MGAFSQLNSLELATASSVPESFLGKQAKHWKLLLVHECWGKTAQATGICISPAFLAPCGWLNEKDAFTAVRAVGRVCPPSEVMLELVFPPFWVPECWQMKKGVL